MDALGGRPELHHCGGVAAGARRADRLVLPSDDDLDDPEVRQAAAEVRNAVSLDLTLATGARPAWLPAGWYERVDGLLDAQALCATDGAAFDPHTVLMWHATDWRDVADDGLEAQVRRFADIYAAPLDEDAATEALAARFLAGLRGAARPATAGDALRPDALEALAREVMGPGARLRPARGYHGPVQPSGFLRGPRDGADALRDRLDALAERVGRDGMDPLLAAAIGYAWLRRLHPLRYGNRRLAILAADRMLRLEPGLAAARAGLGRALAAWTSGEARAVRAATERGAWPAYLRGVLRTLARGLRAGVERRHGYHQAARALAARLRDPDGRRWLGRRRVTPERLAAAAAASPYLGVRGLTEHGLAGRVTAARYLNAFLKLGIARPQRLGRYRLIRVVGLVDALDPPEAGPRRDPTEEGPRRYPTEEAPRRDPPDAGPGRDPPESDPRRDARDGPPRPNPAGARPGLDRLAAAARMRRVCDPDDL